MTLRIVNIDDRTFMIVDEQLAWNVYTVYRDNILIANEAIKRNNVCSICGWYGWFDGEQIKTHMHHMKLDPTHPTGNLIEVCDGIESCHMKIHKGELKV